MIKKIMFSYLFIALLRAKFTSWKKIFLSILSGLYPNMINHFFVLSENSMQIVSAVIVSKSVRMAREAGVPTVALVANMTEQACPSCGHKSQLFEGNGAKRLAEDSGLPLWAEIPFDAHFGSSTDLGLNPETPSNQAILTLADKVIDAMSTEKP